MAFRVNDLFVWHILCVIYGIYAGSAQLPKEDDLRKKILVVDDSEVVLAMASDALTEGGFDVIVASTLLEANSHLFKSEKPDVIVMDVMMPMLNGDKATSLLKNNKLIGHIPILLFSSKSESELNRLVLESGADGFIRKPFTNRLLVEKINGALRQ
jgi:DNA-binding response OmpR family regulator